MVSYLFELREILGVINNSRQSSVSFNFFFTFKDGRMSGVQFSYRFDVLSPL